MPEVVVKRGRGRPKIDGDGKVVGRITRSRARMYKVELMDDGKVIEEVEKKKTRGGAAAGRGRGHGRKGNSIKEAVENEGVDENDRNLKIEPMEIQVVENEVECNNDGVYKRVWWRLELSKMKRNAIMMGIYKRMECKFKLSTTTRGNVIV
ncbi:hypothetical protein ACFE04_027442 [Oxalis oulophora]